MYMFGRNLSSKRKAQGEKLEKSRRLYATISQVNKMILYAREADDLFRRLCSVIVESGKFRMAWVGLIDKENRVIVPVCHAGHEDGYLSLVKISLDPIPSGMDPTGTALREHRHYICNDIRTDPAIRSWKEEALRRSYRSSMALPIFKFGESFGIFSLYSEEPDFFDEEEVRMLDGVTLDISFTLEIFEKEELRKKAEKALRAEKQFSELDH